MLVEALNKIFQTTSSKCVNCDIVTEFLTLMQKFEVILMLDKQRLLIPSLLPKNQQESCIVFPKSVSMDVLEMTCCFEELSKQPYAPMCKLPHPILVRFYLLPFVPNGFFPRLIARLMGSNIMEHLLKSLTTGPLDSHHIFNLIHWQCWRNGVILIWNHFEIFRIAPLIYPLPGTTSAHVISNSGESDVETLKGIEVKVAILPETCIKTCSIIPNKDNVPNKGKCLATWLLHQVSDLVDSVFDDWYEVFARRKSYELSVRSTVNPCTLCFKNVIAAEVAATTGCNTSKDLEFSTSHADFEVISERATKMVLYMFSSPYCALVQAEGQKLECPTHGKLTVTEVAPDLVSKYMEYFIQRNVFMDLFVEKFTVLYCLLFTVYGLLFTVYGLMFTVYGLLFTVYGLWFNVYCFMVYCLLFMVYCLLFTVYCLWFTVYCLWFTVYCLLFTVYGQVVWQCGELESNAH